MSALTDDSFSSELKAALSSDDDTIALVLGDETEPVVARGRQPRKRTLEGLDIDPPPLESLNLWKP